MNEIIGVTDVEPKPDRWLRLTFSDGSVKEVGLGELIATGSVFAQLRKSDAAFRRVRVNAEKGTVEWPGEIDLDPDVLYGRHEPASGARIERRQVRPPR